MKNILQISYLVVLLLGNLSCLKAQNREDYLAASICNELKGFATSSQAQVALNDITGVIGIKTNFVLRPCSSISNALAVTIAGDRVILYDPRFMETISKGNSWAELFILAHEVGHHLNGHTIDLVARSNSNIEPKDLAIQRSQELEADEFAGFILAKLGATMDQALLALGNLPDLNNSEAYSTHPDKNKRIKAVKDGYSRGNESKKTITNSSNKTKVTTNTQELVSDRSKFIDALEKAKNLQEQLDIYKSFADYYLLLGNYRAASKYLSDMYYKKNLNDGWSEDIENGLGFALELDSVNMGAYLMLGDHYFDQAFEQRPNDSIALEKSVTYYRKGYQKDTTCLDCLYGIKYVLNRRDEFMGLYRVSDFLITGWEIEDAENYFSRGKALYYMGYNEYAEKDLKQSILLDEEKNYWANYLFLGWIYESQNKEDLSQYMFKVGSENGCEKCKEFLK